MRHLPYVRGRDHLGKANNAEHQMFSLPADLDNFVGAWFLNVSFGESRGIEEDSHESDSARSFRVSRLSDRPGMVSRGTSG
jgi:hypothetical protein